MADRVRRHRGEGSIYQRPDGRWVAAVDLGIIGGRRVRRTVTAATKRELDVKAKALRKRLDQGIMPSTVSTGEWLDYWAEHIAPKDVRPTTMAGYRSKIALYLKPALGRVRLQDLRPEHVEQLHDWMSTLTRQREPRKGEPLSPTTIRQTHAILQSALAAAVQRERVPRNVAAITRAPSADLNPHSHLSSDDAKRVLRGAESPRELARLTCALILGMRQGEVLGLRWADLQVVDGVPSLIVEESVQRIAGTLTRTDVKSAASHRVIPLPDAVAAILAAWQLEASDVYVFPGPSGGPCDSKADWKAWRASLARAGVGAVPLHGARGSAASLLADMGVPDWRIGQILGHTAFVSRRHYIAGETGPKRAALEGLIAELLP